MTWVWMLACLGGLVLLETEGSSKFVAIPLEDVRLVELADNHNHHKKEKVNTGTVRIARMARGASSKKDATEKIDSPDKLVPEESRVERQAGGGGHHEYVDFGAHTGHHGSFGWYADFPVHKE